MSYYDNQESVANIYVGLVEKGWKCYGYKADQSDSMTDYWSPARWDGIASKNGFILLVDVYSTSQSGYKKTKQAYTPDYSKIEKLRATINDKASSENEKVTSQKIIDTMLNKQKESTIIVEEYPTFSHANPKGCNWHIEKDGNIIAKGKGAFQCDGYLFSSYREETMKKVNSFINKIESKITGTEQLEAVQQEIIKKVIKPVEVTDRNYLKVGDVLSFEYHGHYWIVNSVNEKTFHYELLGSEKRGYQVTKNGKRYYDYLTTLEKNLPTGKIKIYELKEVEEVTYKTVYKKVSRKGQEENLLDGEVTEAPEQKENTIETEVNTESITVELKLNEELNGVELYFNGKPSESVRVELKNNSFRWSRYNKCWYSKQTPQTILFAESLVSIYNDKVEGMEPITMESQQPEEVITQSEYVEPEQVEIVSNEPGNSPYNNDVVSTPSGYYCHFKAWYNEVEYISNQLESNNIPFYEVGEKFIFEGITLDQLKIIESINKENGSILFDDSIYHQEKVNKEPEKDNKPNNVIDFASRLQAKQEQKETESMTNHFIANVLPYLEPDEIIQLQAAQTNEIELDKLWRLLMVKTAVRRATEEMSKQN